MQLSSPESARLVRVVPIFPPSSFLPWLRSQGAADTFGPLWQSAPYVLECFRSYSTQDGRDFSGRTVADAINYYMRNPYDATGEEINALACLVRLGQSGAVI